MSSGMPSPALESLYLSPTSLRRLRVRVAQGWMGASLLLCRQYLEHLDWYCRWQTALTCSLLFSVFLSVSTCSAQKVDYFDSNSERASSAAVFVSDQSLLHTHQVFGATAAQTLDRLDDLLKENGSSLAHAVKLNLYGTSTARKFELDQEIRKRFDSKKLPATIFVVSPLEETGAAIAIDAIATLSEQVKLASERSDHRRLGLTSSNTCFISGQAEKGNGIEEATRNTMASLGKTFDFLETTPSQVQHVKAFIQPMSDAKLARKEIERFFGGGDVPPIVFVEWKSSGLPIEIEMIVTIPRARPAGDDSKITYQTPPHMKSSPVYSRLSLIHSPKVIYTSGLLAEGSAAEQVERTFAELKRILDHHSSDFQHLAKATYYCASDDVSKALNDLRPRFYHPLRPPAASKAMVDPFTESRSTMVIDMILTPK